MKPNNLKKAITRVLIGAPIGLAISTVITIIISLFRNDGLYHAVVPELVNDLGTEMNAVLVQALLSMLYGAAYAGASVIWELDWSLLRQTLTHLCICSLATFPTAYFMHWMEHSVKGACIYFGIFFAIYLIIWLSMYSKMKRRVAIINRKVEQIK